MKLLPPAHSTWLSSWAAGKAHRRWGLLEVGRTDWMDGAEAGASHLEGVAGEPQAQLPADHHGLHNAPVLATHGPPHKGPIPRHQHLHPALVGIPAPIQAQL